MLLEVSGLTKRFGGLAAVSDFHLNMERGELVGLIGPNGAGKTTVFNLITGLYVPSSGVVRFRGADITGLKPHLIARKGIARTFQNLRLFRNLSVLENVMTAAQLGTRYTLLEAVTRLGGFASSERHLRRQCMDLLELVGLADRAHLTAANLPYGLQRKLEIARALATRPTLLLLDEPAAGMNPDESLELMDFIARIRRDFDLTILLIEHHMEVVMGICPRILVLNFGYTIAEGTPDEIRSNPEVIRAYLGEAEE